MNTMPSFKETSVKTVLETYPVTAVLTSERVSFIKTITVSEPVLSVILQNVEKLFKHPDFLYLLS